MKNMLLLLALALLPAANGLRINEVMYNPVLDDNYFEWVELYADESFDFNNATISDSAYTDEIMCCSANCSLNRTGYILIIDKDSKTGFPDALCVDDNLIGNGLGNSGDSITIRKNGEVIDSMSYDASFANGNNHSLELLNGSWLESIAEGGTPGFLNSVANIPVNLTANITVNETANITINQTNSTTTNETNQTANLTNETNSCDVSLEIFTGKTIYEDEPIKFTHVLSNASYNFGIEYWIEDLFGNIVKAKRNTTNLNEKSYTPSIDESEKTLLIKSTLSVNCPDTNLSNNRAEKMVVVKGEEKSSGATEQKQETKTQTGASTAVISKFNYEIISYPEEIVSGEEFTVNVKISGDSKPHLLVVKSYVYKGSKHYSEEVSEEVTLDAGKEVVMGLKNTAEAAPGDYKLKVKIKKDELVTEYDLTADVRIVVATNKTKENETKETEVVNKAGEIVNEIYENYIINLTEPKIIYSSKSNKAKNLVKYLIIGILVAISTVLIWKR
jgi:hypothetical protein